MAYPIANMIITIYVHHMQIDELFDFLNDRIEDVPAYWYSEGDVPYSITGGYVAVQLDYESYAKVRRARSWNDPLNSIK